MNDNQRFISLQYIKGNNYEEIKCFNYETLKNELEKIINKFNSDNDVEIDNNLLLGILNNAIDDDNCKIGDSLLNDLVNYYNFKDIRGLLKKTLLHTQKYNNTELNNKKKEKKNKYKILIEHLKKFREKINEYVNEDTNILIIITPLLTYLETNKDNLYRKEDNINDDIINEKIKKITTDTIENTKDNLLSYIYDNLNKLKTENSEVKNTIIVNIKDKIDILLNILDRLVKKADNEFQKDYDNSQAIIKLYKYYIRLCNANIAKYEKIFKKNEISNIDDAFMIESYSKFLKKLNILKENLESKDEGKLSRLLVNSLNKLFNLYGIDHNKTFAKNDIDYMKNYILYNL